MDLTWDAPAQSWVSDVSRAGPAGTAAITVGGVWVEFDRIDGGRIVSVMVPADSDADLLLGHAARALTPPPAAGDDDEEATTVNVDLTRSPLWQARREFALAAELTEDVARLVRSDANAAVVAYLELARVFGVLEGYAPESPEWAIQRALDLRSRLPKGRLSLRANASEQFHSLIEEVRPYAPASLGGAIDELAHPALVDQEQP